MTNPLRSALLALVLLLALGASLAMASPKDDIIKGNQAARAGRYQQAIRLFSKAISSGRLSRENLAIAYNNRGSAQDDLGRPEQALADYTQAIKIAPSHADAYYNRSFVHEKQGRMKQALADMQTAVRLQPQDPDFRQRLNYLRTKLPGRR